MAGQTQAPLLSAKGVEKSFGAAPLFVGLDLHLVPRARVGLIGDNGTGKSSLLKVLAGAIAPDAGEVVRQHGVQVALLAQSPDFGERTIFEVLAEPLAAQRRAIAAYTEASGQLSGSGSSSSSSSSSGNVDLDALGAEVEASGGWQWEHRLAQAASQLQLPDLQRSCATLSGGQQKRVALAQLLLSPAEVLLLDEPTNHLDIATITWLEGALAALPKTVVVVTHDRVFLDQVATVMAELRDGKVSTYAGNYSDYLVARAEEEALAARQRHRQQRHLAHELAWARRSPAARTTKNRARLERVEAAAARLQQGAAALPLGEMLLGQAPRLGREILHLEEVTCGPAGSPPLFAPLSLRLCAGERWGIVGPNGTGKTSLLRIVAEQAAPTSGKVHLGKNSRVAYFDQHRTALDLDLSVGATLLPDGGDQVIVAGKVLHISQLLQRFGFAAEIRQRRVATLSGGERNRLALAKFFQQQVNVLLLDEPTNDLDLLTLGVLEQAIVDFAGCVLLVSHDRAFLGRVCTGIVGLHTEGEGGGAARVPLVVQGDYDHYQAHVQQRAIGRAAAPNGNGKVNRSHSGQAAAEATSRPRRRPVRPPQLTLPERRELEAMEGVIEAAEGQLAKIAEELADPGLWQGGGGEGQALAAAMEAQKGQVERLYDRWQALLDKQAQANAT